jgi:hypothetical protein
MLLLVQLIHQLMLLLFHIMRLLIQFELDLLLEPVMRSVLVNEYLQIGITVNHVD